MALGDYGGNYEESWKVPADVQAERDKRALALKIDEQVGDPSNEALAKDIAFTAKRMGVSVPPPEARSVQKVSLDIQPLDIQPLQIEKLDIRPLDDQGAEKGYVRRALEAVPSGIEAAARTGVSMAGNILGFAPSYAIEKFIAGNPDAAATALNRFGESFDKVPRIGGQTQEIEDMIGKGMEAFTQGGGSAAAAMVESLNGPLDPMSEARARMAGEIGSNLVPIPLLGRGKKGAAPKPTLEKAPVSPYDELRAARPQLQNLSDPEIKGLIDNAEKEDRQVTRDIVGGEQTELFSPDQVNPERVQRLSEWQKEEDARNSYGLELEREVQTGQKDLFGFRDSPKFLDDAQLEALAQQPKLGDAPMLETTPERTSLNQITKETIRKEQESLLGLTEEKAAVLQDAYADQLSALRTGEQKTHIEGLRRAAEIEAKNYNPLSEKAPSLLDRWFRNDGLDVEVKSLLETGPQPAKGVLSLIAEKGTPIQRLMAEVLASRVQTDTLKVSFGKVPVSEAARLTERIDPVPRAFGRFYSRANEALVRHDYNITQVALHEIAHGVTLGHIQRYLDAKGVGKRGLENLNLGNKNRFRAVERLDDIFMALRMHAGANPLGTVHIRNAFKDLHEFVSDLTSDPNLQKWLEGVNMKDLNLEKDHSKSAPSKEIFQKKGLLQEIWSKIKQLWDPENLVPERAWIGAQRELIKMLGDVTAHDQTRYFDFRQNPLTQGPELKKALPDQFKHLAKYIDKADIKPQSAERAVLEQRPAGMDRVIDRFTPDLRSADDVIKATGPVKDISGSIFEKIGQRLVSGMKMYSWIKEHPYLKWGIDVAYDAKKNVESRAQQLLRDPETGLTTRWEALSRKEQAALGEVILDGKKSKRNFTAQELSTRGLNQKQIEAYQSGRKMFDGLWTEFNAERLSQGMEPVPPVEGYWPSRWSGNWQMATYSKNADGTKGRLLRVDRADNRYQLDALGERLRSDDKYFVDKVESTPRMSELKDSFGLFNHIMDVVGRNSPEGRALSQTMDRYAQELADKQGRLFRRHYEPSAGIGGYLGDPFTKNPTKAAKELIRSAEGYVKDGLDWMYSSRAGRELDNFHRQAGAIGQENTSAVIRMNWDKLNNKEGMITRPINMILEAGPEALGLDRNMLKKFGIDMKREVTLMMLGYGRPIFLAAQFVQPHQFVPSAIKLLEGRTGRSSETGVLGLGFKAHADAYKALTKDFDGPEGANRKAAIQYLKENRIIDPHFMDTAHDLFQRDFSKIMNFARGETAMAFSERYARTNAFFQFDRWLKETHPEMSQQKRFETAGELAEGTMTNYRRFERAQIFHDLGFVGDMASGLMTFKINMASQLYMYMKEALVHKNPKPLAILLGIQALYAGLMGMPGREEFDDLINLGRRMKVLPAKFPTATEFLLSSSNKIDNSKVSDSVRYGPFSGATGVDISPTFAAGALLPDARFSSWFPVLNKGLKLGDATLDVLKAELGRIAGGQGATRSDWWNLAKQGPTSLQGFVEKGMQNPQTGIIPDPAKAMEGTVTRPIDPMTKAWGARALGARTTQEANFNNARYTVSQSDSVRKSLQEGYVEQAKKLQADQKDWNPQLRGYMDAGGDPTTFINAVVNANQQIHIDQKTREALKTRTPEQLQRWLQLRSMYRDQ